ncbi:CD99 antigen-like isoform X2 [Anolis sagrei]|uniref:CD99 antigen-like isoform X2 n=1 Tax=Anolis sagrei TaxID=38937 RepID=UPI0035206262
MKLIAVLLGAGCVLLSVSGYDGFDLSDAIGMTVTKRPNPTTKRPPVGDNPRPNLYPDLRPHGGSQGSDDSDFNLEDALVGGGGSTGGGGSAGGSSGNSNSGGHGSIGGHAFNDLDLNDGKPLPPAGERPHVSDQGGNNVDASSTAQITSPVVAVVVLLAVGALAGYTSYKQKRYCFKPRGAAVV